MTRLTVPAELYAGIGEVRGFDVEASYRGRKFKREENICQDLRRAAESCVSKLEY